MTRRTARRLRALGRGLRTVAAGALLASGFMGLCWLLGLAAPS